jgi:hypothetical protein
VSDRPGHAIVVTRARAAGAASLVLAIAAIAFLLVGPVYLTAGSSCSSDGGCIYSIGTAPLGWSSVLLVPIVAAGLVLGGAALSRSTRPSDAVAGLGCLGLAVITFLGVFSIGVFLLPADAAAVLAFVWLRQRGQPRR